MIRTESPWASLNPHTRRLEKLWNTYVRLPLPWMYRPAPHRHWEHQEPGGQHGADQFLRLTATSEALLDEVATRAASSTSPILDLGCNVGRHLHALWERGFRNLHGVDIQHSALALMEQVFPQMMTSVTVSQGTFQDYLPGVADRAFDISFTHGATVELVPPSFPICRELARVTRGAVILLIGENAHYYPRLWEAEFLRAGFILTKLLRPATAGSQSSLLVFVPAEL